MKINTLMQISKKNPLSVLIVASSTACCIGLSIQPLLRSSELQKAVIVSSVMPGTPAQTAGFKPGDILIRMAGNDITVRYAEELPVFNQMVALLPIRQEAEAQQHELKQWGMQSLVWTPLMSS